MTLWDIIDHWPQISIKELEHIINYRGRRQPLLQPYERERPASGISQENYFLAPMHRGHLSIIDYHGYFRNVLDCTGKKVSSDRAYDIDNDGWPLDNCLYFLLRDVRRIEQEHPEYLQEIVVHEEPVQEAVPQEASVPEATQASPKPPVPDRTILPVMETSLVDDVLLKDVEVAKHLGITRKTVWVWVKQGRIPSPVRLVGAEGSKQGTTRWSRNEILAYIERLKTERK